MKKASDVLIIIGFIFGIIAAIGLLIGTIMFFIMASPMYKEMIIQMIQEKRIHTTIPGTPEQQYEVIKGMLIGGGIGMLFGTLFVVAMCIVSMMARSKVTMGLYIATIVLSVLGGNILVVVGGALGIVSITDEKEKPQQIQQ